MVEAAASLLPREDRDAAELVQGRFEAEGLRVLTGHAVTSFAREGGAKVVVCASSQGEVRLECDEVLMALGRRATVTGFGLEELGVELRRNGTVEVDDFLQTNYPGIFACGDVRSGSVKRCSAAVGEGGMAVEGVHQVLSTYA